MMTTMSEIGSAIWSPVKTSGMAEGSTICHNSWRRVTPRLCADQMRYLSTLSVAAQVATTTGKTDENATIAIFDQSNTPNQRMKIGKNAIFGSGLPIDTIGSKNQRTKRSREIVTPIMIPATAAIEKPAKVRAMVRPRPTKISPETMSFQRRASTVDKEGSRKSDTKCIRAAHSHPTARMTTEDERRILRRQGDSTLSIPRSFA